jgi:hypothetical protein
VQHDKPRRLHIVLAWAAVAVPLALLVVIGGVGFASSPGCDACHRDSVFTQATSTSAHAAITCGACHGSATITERVLKGYSTVAHAFIAPLGVTRGEYAAVADVRCLSCHDTVNDDILESKGLRIDHVVCAEGARCTDCHSATAHGEATSWKRAYDMDTCLECHLSEAASACDTCHVGRPPDDRITSGIFAVTHGPDWQKTHGMGNSATCSACHTAVACERCHGPGLPHDQEFMSNHGSFAVSAEARCGDCHEDSYCESCHGLQMPHPNSFVRGHAAESGADEALCRRCHAESDCITCHVTHVHPGGSIGTLQDGGLRQ